MFSVVTGILCFFSMLTTMPESVMPAISMSCRSSAISKRSTRVNLSACTPAPPEWMSVPSISKSTRRLCGSVMSSEVFPCLPAVAGAKPNGSRHLLLGLSKREIKGDYCVGHRPPLQLKCGRVHHEHGDHAHEKYE